MFSFPNGLDTNFDIQKPPHLLEETTNFRSFNPKKKNFSTTKMKKGSLDQALFSSPGYNSIGDPYVDPRRLKLRSESLDMRKNTHGKEFRPGGRVKTRFNSEFLNTPNDTPLGGSNRTHGPRGFFTSPGKHGIGPGTLLQRNNYDHMIDEYDRKRELDREERRMRRTQDMGKPFSNVVKGKNTFGSNYDEYGEDNLNIQDKKPKFGYEGLKHGKPFLYSNESRWIGKTINAKPGYQEEGIDVDPADRIKQKRDVLPWRPTYKRLSEPSDAIVSKYMNRPKYSFV